jgi:hypothetical protein
LSQFVNKVLTLFVVTALILAATALALPVPATRATAVARARIVSGARISFSTPPRNAVKGKSGLIEFQ